MFVRNKFVEQDLKIDELFFKFDNGEFKETIFFEGQIYDVYSLMMKILSKAKNEIIIIDNYAGKELFDLLKDINIPIKLYSKNINKELIKKI